MLVPP